MNLLTFETIEKLAKTCPGRVAVPFANNSEALEAIKEAAIAGTVKGGSLIGPKENILELCKKMGLDTRTFDFVNVATQEEACDVATTLISKGEADFLLKGQVDTKIYMKAILNKEKKLIKEGNLLSHVALMSIPAYHKFLVISDAAITINPSVEEKIKITQNAINFCHQLGIKTPKVALVCAVEKVNPKMPSTVDASEVVKAYQIGRITGGIVEGPYDLYIAVSAKAAEEKGVKGQVPGDADILIMHNIDGCNALYKAINAFVPNAKTASLIAGATIPVILPSRADPSETKRLSLSLAAVLTSNKK